MANKGKSAPPFLWVALRAFTETPKEERTKDMYPKEFVEWCGELCGHYGKGNWYYIKQTTPECIQMDFDSTNELYQYWQKEIRQSTE